MSELTLLMVKFGFLALLWVFVFAIIYALRTDLFGDRVKRLQEEAYTGQRQALVEAKLKAAHEIASGIVVLTITSGPRAGLDITLTEDVVTIGRAAESTLVIRDDYTSTHHARLTQKNNLWQIEDLDSTNGTSLNGQKISGAVEVPVNTPIKIGTTTFELRK